MNVKTKKGLGRGLEAIFELEKINLPDKNKKKSIFDEIEIEKISPNPKQPRTLFDEEALEELAESIRNLGVIQPITVKKNDGRTVPDHQWRKTLPCIAEGRTRNHSRLYP